ncbi:hypothetical protein M0R72_10920 [Candidatus Pacearchaeota archaeon]|jgi:hypothetical protein|nr:hypothetical protein [Candidatus Pacearchaeota archaeon]
MSLLPTREAAKALGESRQWVRDHRTLFDCRPLPGRGRYGQELRFTAASIAEYVRSRREPETVGEIIQQVKRESA